MHIITRIHINTTADNTVKFLHQNLLLLSKPKLFITNLNTW